MGDLTYKGWKISSHPGHPVTGQFRATRHGVRMGTTTLEGLKRMIDLKAAEEQRARDKREGDRL